MELVRLSNHVLEFLQQRPLFVRQQLGIAYNIEKQNVSDLQVEMRLVDTRSATSSLAKLPDCGNMAVKRRVRTALSKVERLLPRPGPRLRLFCQHPVQRALAGSNLEGSAQLARRGG